jgi:uncharacterized membrane protein
VPTNRSRLALAAFMSGAGVAHFVIPRFYEAIIPRPLRDHDRFLVRASGVAEIACGALVAVPRTRRVGAWATVLVLIGVFPANVQHALDEGGPVWLRLPLQWPMIRWAHAHTR